MCSTVVVVVHVRTYIHTWYSTFIVVVVAEPLLLLNMYVLLSDACWILTVFGNHTLEGSPLHRVIFLSCQYYYGDHS